MQPPRTLASMTDRAWRLSAAALIALACVGGGISNSAHAAMFDDDEARKAILDLRAKVDANQRTLVERMDKLEAASRSQLELANQIELLRQDIARLRGQVESLTNELANTQTRQKDFYVDLDGRLRKFEPKQATVDGKSGLVDQTEQRGFDAAMNLFKNSDFKGAINAFSAFLTQYPTSVYAPQAQYWAGTSFYAQRDYKAAIAAQQIVVRNWPDSPRAADALLNIASSQTDLGDKRAARKTLETLIAQYPETQSATVARDRLAAMH